MKIAETPRLIIEEARPDDAAFFYRLMTSDSWLRYIGDRGIFITADAISYIENRLMVSYRENGYGLFKVRFRDSEEAIGVCGFLKRQYLDYPDIGYALLPEYEGKGLMLEAARAVMEFGQQKLGLPKIYAFTDPGNERSRRLLDKIGFEEVRTFQPEDFDDPCVLFVNRSVGDQPGLQQHRKMI